VFKVEAATSNAGHVVFSATRKAITDWSSTTQNVVLGQEEPGCKAQSHESVIVH